MPAEPEGGLAGARQTNPHLHSSPARRRPFADMRVARLALEAVHANRTLAMIFGRFVWIGHQSEIIWVTFTMYGTIYDQFEVTIGSRYAMQLADEATVGNVKGPWGNDAVVLKIIRVQFGQPFSRPRPRSCCPTGHA
ncbi:hypothetical protein PG989_000122 [Apiospora arundinis]